MKEAIVQLEEIDKVVNFFQKEAKKDQNLLLLVTGSAPENLDFPQSGKDWRKNILKGQPFKSRPSELTSPVFATGARAENFCGYFDQTQIFQRIFWGTKKSRFQIWQ